MISITENNNTLEVVEEFTLQLSPVTNSLTISSDAKNLFINKNSFDISISNGSFSASSQTSYFPGGW